MASTLCVMQCLAGQGANVNTSEGNVNQLKNSNQMPNRYFQSALLYRYAEHDLAGQSKVHALSLAQSRVATVFVIIPTFFLHSYFST